jgi:hypothetical protein
MLPVVVASGLLASVSGLEGLLLFAGGPSEGW